MLVTIVAIIGFVLIILGFAGSVLPAMPGPPLCLVALAMLAIVTGFSPPLTVALLIVMAVITTVTAFVDYIVPVIGARRYGASAWGVWGSIIGMIAGIVFFPPFGMVLGTIIGAVVFEIIGGKGNSDALRAGWGVFVGTMAGLVVKFAACGVMTYYFIRALFAL